MSTSRGSASRSTASYNTVSTSPVSPSAVSNSPAPPSPSHTSTPASTPPPRPSSADAGFFQDVPKLGNQFRSDIGLQRVLRLYVTPSQHPSLYSDLERLGDLVLSRPILNWLEDAERNLPYVLSHDAFAHRRDTLHTSEGWRKLSDLGAKEGCVAEAYEGEQGRIGQFARYYIFSPSCAFVTCPFGMTDGAARLLSHHLNQPKNPITNPRNPHAAAHAREAEAARHVFRSAYLRLISRDEGYRWTSGQWMTERPGGSDVSRSETTAVYSPLLALPSPRPELEPGPWVINGYKFFSSATDADMTILLARTAGVPGLSVFYAPMRFADGSSNGVRIVRLKSKLGTKAVPTAELELRGMRAWLIGTEGNGVRQISTILNITRVHNSLFASSFMGRALSIAKAFSRVRVVARGRPLWTVPLHMRTLAQLELQTRAAQHLGFLSAHVLQLSENPSRAPPGTALKVKPAAAAKLLRLLAPLSKAVTAKMSIAICSEAVESLGGVGYLENEEPLNLARLLRDAQVLSIWEGTTNVLITDLVGSLKRLSPSGSEERAYTVLSEFLRENLAAPGVVGEVGEVLEHCKVAIWSEWLELEKIIETESREELTLMGRRVMWRLAWVVVGMLLLVDARSDEDVVAVECCRRWVGKGEAALLGERAETKRDGESRWDVAVVFGKAEGGRRGLKL